MRHIIPTFLLFFAGLVHAGDTPIYSFKLGEWNFLLSSVGTPGGGPVVAVLEAEHKAKKISGQVSLDYRWYGLAHRQFEKGERSAKPFLEALLAFSATEWKSGLNGEEVLNAMKDSPPTPDFKQLYSFLVNAQNK